jgi:hypothetical protein
VGVKKLRTLRIAAMKRITEFKGYRTGTVYDKATGQFVEQRVHHDGFEAKAEPPKPTSKKPVRAIPPASAAERLAALKRRIEAGRAAARASLPPRPAHQ